MNDHTHFIQAAHLYLQASDLVLSTMPLQYQIQACNDELTLLITLERRHKDESDRIRDLRDEIFGCKIEIQALREKAQRLKIEAQSLRLSESRFNRPSHTADTVYSD